MAFAPDRYAPFASVGRRLGLYAYGWLVPDESPPPSFRQLSLPPSSHTHGAVVGSRRVDQGVPFLDLVVDGVPLRKMVQEVGFGDDFATLLSPRWYRAAVQTAIGRFLNGHGEPGEHVDMLVCSVCADRDCGAVLADVTLTDEAVSWSNWRWANWDSEAERRLALPTMRFQRSAYEEVLAGALAALAALPYEDVFPPRKAVSPPWRWGWRLPRRKP